MFRTLFVPSTPVRRLAAVGCAAALTLTSSVAFGLPANADPEDTPVVAEADPSGSGDASDDGTTEVLDPADLAGEGDDTRADGAQADGRGPDDAGTAQERPDAQDRADVLAAAALAAEGDDVPSADDAAAVAGALVVTTLADSGPGSLREAVDLAGAAPGLDVITVDPSLTGDIVLESGLLVSSSVRIDGPGADKLRLVPGAGVGALGEAFVTVGSVDEAAAPDVTLHGLTLGTTGPQSIVTNRAPSGDPLFLASVTLDQAALSTVYMDWAYVTGDVDVTGTSLQDSQLVVAEATGDVTTTGSTFSGGSMFAMYDIGGDVTMSEVEVSAPEDVYNFVHMSRVRGAVTIADSTFSGNVSVINLYETHGPTTIRGVEMSTEAGTSLGGFNILSARGPVTVSDTVTRGRYAPIQIGSHDEAQTPVPVVLQNITVEGTEEDWSTAVTISGAGIGTVDISGLDITQQASAISLFSISGEVTVVDSTLSATGRTTANPAVVASSLSAGLRLERTTIEGFQLGVYAYAVAGPVVLSDSVVRDLTGPAVMVQGGGDALLDSVHVARTAGAAQFSSSGDQTLTVRASTFEDVAPDDMWGMSAAIDVADGRLDISGSTFYQGAAVADDQTHFVQVNRSGSSATDEVVRIASSTFAGLGVLRSNTLGDADEVVVSHVVGDSRDEVGQVEDGHADLVVEQGGRLVVDHSIFSATKDEMAAGAADVAWGESNQTGVGAQEKKLGAPTDNGGPTPTMLLLAGSVALDAGDPTFVGTGLTDQRGLPRVYRTVDVGAVEMNYGSLSLSGTATVTAGETAELVVSRVDGHDSVEGPVSVRVLLVPGTAEHGVDYTGPVDKSVVLSAGVDTTTVSVPTTAVLDRGDRTLTAQLVADLSKTPTVDPGTVELTIVHPTTSVPPPGPTDPAEPTDPTVPTDPADPATDVDEVTSPVTSLPEDAADATAATRQDEVGAGGLASTGASTGTVLVVMSIVLVVGLAVVSSHRGRRSQTTT